MRGDYNRYFQVLLNLMSNALKFTGIGKEVHVKLTVTDVQQRIESLNDVGEDSVDVADKQEEGLKEFTVRFKIEVIDEGRGIPKKDLQHLFMDFSKLDQHENINKQGTGLGLSICKRIIEEMGGQVTVDSVVGQGSTFIVTICTTMRAESMLVDKLLGK